MDWGDESDGVNNVREVDIAAANGRAMVVFIKDGFEIGFAYYDGTSWTNGSVQDFVVGRKFEDPSVVPVTMNIGGVPTPGFVCAYKDGGMIYAKQFDEVSGFGGRIDISPASGGIAVDKPWLIPGAMNPSGFQDVHAIWFKFNFNLWSAVSSDGGGTWTAQPVPDPLTAGEHLHTGFCAQQAIHSTAGPGPYYVATTPAPTWPTWKILEANDVSVPPNPPQWQFDYLSTSGGVLEIKGKGQVNGQIHVPGEFRVRTVPYLVADPTDSNRLYFFYHGLTEENGFDLDVFCRTVTKTGSTWSAGAPVRVNDLVLSNPGEHYDQIFPAAEADNQGRLHAAFYDDRGIDGQPDTATEAIFNLYYAVSVDGGATFTNIRMTGIPHRPTLDTTLTGRGTANAPELPGEYPGIACDENIVWIAFAGTSTLDDNVDKSVIFVLKIEY